MAAGEWARETPDYVMVCPDGHVTDSRDDTSWSRPLPFDVRVFCRRKNPAYGAATFGRCSRPVTKLNQRPDLDAAFRLGGEDAVRAIIFSVPLDHP